MASEREREAAIWRLDSPRAARSNISSSLPEGSPSLGFVRDHLFGEHLAAALTDEQIREIVATCAYRFEYAEVDSGSVEDEFGLDPY